MNTLVWLGGKPMDALWLIQVIMGVIFVIITLAWYGGIFLPRKFRDDTGSLAPYAGHTRVGGFILGLVLLYVVGAVVHALYFDWGGTGVGWLDLADDQRDALSHP